VRIASSAFAIALWVTPAVAGVVATSGKVVLVAAPPSVVSPNAAEDGVIHLFVEQTDVVLPADVKEQVNGPCRVGRWKPGELRIRCKGPGIDLCSMSRRRERST